MANEALVYLFGVSKDAAHERIGRFIRELAAVTPQVTGADLVEMGLEPGPDFSAILDRALDDRLDGIAVGREAELAHLRDIVDALESAD